jgi:putative flippase GtrA
MTNPSVLKKELFRFIIAGIAAVGTDMATYYILISFLDKNWSKGISFLIGTIVAYLVNKFWTFGQNKKSYKEMIRFLILYLSTLLVNVAVNRSVLIFNQEFIFAAFLAATFCSATLNFLGQKFWVFK